MGKVKSELATEEDFERIERESKDYFESNKSCFEELLEWKCTEVREEYEHWLDTVDDWPEGIDGD